MYEPIDISDFLDKNIISLELINDSPDPFYGIYSCDDVSKQYPNYICLEGYYTMNQTIDNEWNCGVKAMQWFPDSKIHFHNTDYTIGNNLNLKAIVDSGFKAWNSILNADNCFDLALKRWDNCSEIAKPKPSQLFSNNFSVSQQKNCATIHNGKAKIFTKIFGVDYNCSNGLSDSFITGVEESLLRYQDITNKFYDQTCEIRNTAAFVIGFLSTFFIIGCYMIKKISNLPSDPNDDEHDYSRPLWLGNGYL